MDQAGVDKEKAVKSIKEADGDLISASKSPLLDSYNPKRMTADSCFYRTRTFSRCCSGLNSKKGRKLLIGLYELLWLWLEVS
jgi:hypothetical protein